MKKKMKIVKSRRIHLKRRLHEIPTLGENGSQELAGSYKCGLYNASVAFRVLVSFGLVFEMNLVEFS